MTDERRRTRSPTAPASPRRCASRASASRQVDAGAEAAPHLSSADQATVDALRAGTALLVVLRGPNTGARFLLDDDEVSSGRHPDSDIFLDDVTVSRKHASLPPRGRRLPRARRRVAQRHLRQPASGSTRPRCTPVTRCRSASSGSSSTPAPARPREPRARERRSRRSGRMTIGAVLAQLQPDFPDVTISKIRFLEAEGLVTPARTGSGYRTFSERRRRAAALHPHRPARPVLAAEGDPRRPRRPRPGAAAGRADGRRRSRPPVPAGRRRPGRADGRRPRPRVRRCG